MISSPLYNINRFPPKKASIESFIDFKKSSSENLDNDKVDVQQIVTTALDSVSEQQLTVPLLRNIDDVEQEDIVSENATPIKVYLTSGNVAKPKNTNIIKHKSDNNNNNNPTNSKAVKVNRKRQVYICVVFLKIGEIDTIKEQYSADILIKSKWREPTLDYRHGKVEYDWTNSWTPKLYIENTIGEAKEHVYQMIIFNENQHAFLCEKRRVSGVFLENLELDHFPFDVQDLTVTIASNLPTTDIRLVNDPDEAHKVNKQSFVDEQEWYLFKHIETEQHELAYEYADPASVKPALSVKCRAARRPAYFIWNIFLVTFLICSLSLVTFSVESKYPQNRLQLTFTLVLTLVAFKFVVNQCLPKISYLTYLDKYVISSLFILTLICVWHGLIVIIERVAKSKNYKLPPNMEVYVIIAMALGFAAYNIGFVIVIYERACKRRRIMKLRDKEYLEKLQCQLKHKGARTIKMTQQTHQLHEVRENGTGTFL